MSTQSKPYLTANQYLEIDRTASVRSEYYNGEMFPMEAATGRHCTIVMNLTGILRPQFRKRGCRLYETTMKLRIREGGPYLYPDVVGICPPQPAVNDQALDVLTDALLVVEVLSPSTGKYDRTFKLEKYQAVPSLQDYLIVWQDRVHAELLTRSSDGSWLATEVSNIEQEIWLPSIEYPLKLADVYDDSGIEGSE